MEPFLLYSVFHTTCYGLYTACIHFSDIDEVDDIVSGPVAGTVGFVFAPLGVCGALLVALFSTTIRPVGHNFGYKKKRTYLEKHGDLFRGKQAREDIASGVIEGTISFDVTPKYVDITPGRLSIKGN